jgi:hypothetical protein
MFLFYALWWNCNCCAYYNDSVFAFSFDTTGGVIDVDQLYFSNFGQKFWGCAMRLLVSSNWQYHRSHEKKPNKAIFLLSIK